MQATEIVKKILSKKFPKIKIVETRSLNYSVLLVKPKNVLEIQSCLHLASKYAIKVRVISQGKNWGYQAHSTCQLVMDLSRLNKIYDFNEELAYIAIEPGVTFNQIYMFLKKRQSRLMLSVTGGSPDASVIATTTQRGIGKGLYADFYNYSCAYEVVLPSGEIVRTGFSEFTNARVKHIDKYGVGPSLDGLFTQLNLGIVTKMTIWLKPRPTYLQLFTFTLNGDTKLPQLVDTIRFLKLNDIIRGNFLFANHYRYITSQVQYPWKQAGYKTPLSDTLLNHLKKKTGFVGKWRGEYAIFAANKQLSNAYKKTIRDLLLPVVDSLDFLDAPAIESIKKFNHFHQNLSNETRYKAQNIVDYFENSPYTGVPRSDYLKSLYWRKKNPIPAYIDPERDLCGIVWFNSVIPLQGEVVLEVAQIIEKIMIDYTFEPNIGFNFISERTLYLIGVILYDKAIPEEHTKAAACYRKIISLLTKKGYYPYRFSRESHSFPSVLKQTNFVRQIKKLFDKNLILE